MHFSNCVRALLAASVLLGAAVATPVPALEERGNSKNIVTRNKKQSCISPKVFIISMVSLARVKALQSLN